MHRKDNIQDYADPSGHSQAWHGNPVYPQNHPQHPLPSSYPHPHVTPMDHQWVPPEYMARLAPQQGPYPYSIAHEESTQAHLTYSPASSSGPQTPAFQGAPSTAFSVLAQLPSRGSPSPMPLPIDETLPSNVRSALQAAYKTNEWAQGENVPAEVIMPTVQKLSNDSWVCLIWPTSVVTTPLRTSAPPICRTRVGVANIQTVIALSGGKVTWKGTSSPLIKKNTISLAPTAKLSFIVRITSLVICDPASWQAPMPVTNMLIKMLDHQVEQGRVHQHEIE
ncbi:hypothetical protein FRC17_000382 [Serendipita sp. 399]|nr:hypothetical protein FRC17_000382 [Serendipita sp. 399]